MRFFFTLAALTLAGAAQAKAGDWVPSGDSKFKIKTPTDASWARCETVHVEYFSIGSSEQPWSILMEVDGAAAIPLASGTIAMKGSGTIEVPLTDMRLYKYGQQSVDLHVGAGGNMAAIGPFKVQPRPSRFKYDCST
ncbi:hypothetical protein T439DRAFT_383341 [Meredithblackwellia eburnea MCA 4105]